MKKLLKMIFTLFFFATIAHSAPRPGLTIKPNNLLINEGALQGGLSGTETSLLDLRNTVARAKNQERIVLDLGDSRFNKLQGRIGYYTVELKKNRLIVNLNQTLATKIADKDLKFRFQNSLNIASSKILFDPIGQTMTLVLDLKRPVAVKVIGVNGIKEGGKLVLDLLESKRVQ